MDSLFGVPLTSILIALLALVGGIFGLLAWIGYRQPLLVRMGLRNIARRKTQTALIVIGLMLSTLIISAAFATGDTVGYSVTNAVYNDFQNADLVVALGTDHAAAGVDSITDANLAAVSNWAAGDQDVDGVTGLSQLTVPAINQSKRLSEPRALFVGVDPATVAPFHGLVAPDGNELPASALTGDNVYITERLAEDIDLGIGDHVTLYYNNQPADFTVVGIVADNALTSQTALTSSDGQSPSGGIVTSLARLREVSGKANDLDLIVLSVRGGSRDTLKIIPNVETRLKAFIASSNAPLEVVATKAQIVKVAELVGSIFVTFFLVFGLFSIAAGIMLIFLTFVMLAAERRSEMGMARAVGMKRLHLTQTFIAEGMAYNLGSALIGALLGLGVAYSLIFVLGHIFSRFGLNIAFHFNPEGFLIAYCLGVVLTFVTVAFASWRAANLNIVRAIRDLPEPQPLRGRDTSLSGLTLATVGVAWYVAWLGVLVLAGLIAVAIFFAGLASAGLGYLLYLPVIGLVWLLRRTVGRALAPVARWATYHRNPGGWAVWMLGLGIFGIIIGGWVIGQAFAYTAGTTLVLLAAAMLAVYFGVAARPAFTLASAALVWYWLLPLPFSLLFEAGKGWHDPLNGLASLVGLGHDPVTGNIEMFFVSGISITASATLLVIFNADRLLGALRVTSGVLGGITPALRTAVAYPLASKFRTAMTLAMFGLVVFSLVVMATLNYNFTQLFLGSDASGGFDVTVQANANNRIPDLRAALDAANPEVATGITAIGTLTAQRVQARTAAQPDDKAGTYLLQGVDDTFLDNAHFPLATRAAGYDSDAAVLAALRSDPTLAIVDETRLSTAQGGGFGGDTQQQFQIPRSTTDLQAAPWTPIPIVVSDPTTGTQVTVQVIGVIKSQVTSVVRGWSAIFVNQSVLRDRFANGDSESFAVVTADHSELATKREADAIEAALLEQGVQATSIQQQINDAAAQSSAFQLLFEGFMGLGLVVGIAALGVIAFRSVAERRQQIGMMRAIGYSRRLIAISFFLESSFIALTGVVMGLVLGAALSYNLLTSPDFTNGATITFGVPWVRLFVIVAVAYGASALMTLIPARSAARVPVAEALRYNG